MASDFTSPVGFYEVTFAHFDVILFAAFDCNSYVAHVISMSVDCMLSVA